MFKILKKLKDLESRVEKLEDIWKSQTDSIREMEAIKKYVESEEAFHDASNIVIETNNPSTIVIKNKLKLGYAQALFLMDKLEDNGVVSPADDHGKRYIVGF